MSLEDVCFLFLFFNKSVMHSYHTYECKGQLTFQEDIQTLTCSHCKPVSFIWPSRPYATQPLFSLQASVFLFIHYNQTSQSPLEPPTDELTHLTCVYHLFPCTLPCSPSQQFFAINGEGIPLLFKAVWNLERPNNLPKWSQIISWMSIKHA